MQTAVPGSVPGLCAQQLLGRPLHCCLPAAPARCSAQREPPLGIRWMRCAEAADKEWCMEQLSSWDRLPHSPWKRGGGCGAFPCEPDQGLSWARGKCIVCLSLREEESLLKRQSISSRPSFSSLPTSKLVGNFACLCGPFLSLHLHTQTLFGELKLQFLHIRGVMCSCLREQLLPICLLLPTVWVSRMKRRELKTIGKNEENEQVFGKGVMTAQRNGYRKGGNEKKKYKTYFFLL